VLHYFVGNKLEEYKKYKEPKTIMNKQVGNNSHVTCDSI